MFRPASGNLQEMHINYMHKILILCKYTILNLGVNAIRRFEGYSRDTIVFKYSVCSGFYKCTGLQLQLQSQLF